MGNRLTESIYLVPVTEKQIDTVISALRDTATGFDDMNSMPLKISSEFLVKTRDDLILFNNYIPVSALCVLSKVFEKLYA